MNKVKYRVTLDLTRPGVQHTIYAKKNDALSREVVFALRTKGKAYKISSGTSAYLYALADGIEIFADCEISGSAIIAPLTTNILAAKDILLEVRLTNNTGAILTTPQVKVVSEEALYSEDAITATDDFSALLSAIVKAENARIVDITAENNILIIKYADGQTVSFDLNLAVEDAVSPTVSISDVKDGHRITVTDVNGEKSFDVMDGTSVTVTDVSQSDEDGGENIITFSCGKTLTVKNGKDGTSPTANVENIAGGHRVTITDEKGAHTFDVMDGAGGSSQPLQYTTFYADRTGADIYLRKDKATPKSAMRHDIIDAVKRGGIILVMFADDDETEMIPSIIDNGDVISLNVVDSNGKTYVFLSYKPLYSVTNKLSACTTNNSVTTVEAESTYTATISGVQHQGFLFRKESDFKVTMGGVDITATAVSHGTFPSLTLNINIPKVTGNIYITASAG